LSAFGSSASSLQQISGRDAQSFCDPNDIFDSGIADAALNVAEVSAVEVSFFHEGFLGKTFGSPMLRYALPE
jgi:hypothetical protein